MYLIAIRNLLKEKASLIISVGGVALSILLMLTLMGMYSGILSQMSLFISKNQSDLFVAAKGVGDLSHGLPPFPETALADISQEAETAGVIPVIAQRANAQAGETKADMTIFSFDPAQPDRGGPWKVTGGTAAIGNGEIVVAKAVAKKLGKQVGEKVTVNGQELTIAGLAGEASTFGQNYAWVSLEQARAMTNDSGLVNLAYIKLKDPAGADDAAARLAKAHPDLAILTKQAFLKSNDAQSQAFLPAVAAIVFIAVLVGVSIVGLTSYAAIISHSREYGLLKAIGLTNWQLYRVVLAQAGLATFGGLVIGVGLAFVTAQAVNAGIDLLPRIGWTAIGIVTALAVAMATGASLLPVRRLLKIDPAEVFKA